MKKGQIFMKSWNYKRNCLNKVIKKENFKKELTNLIETNHQINMTSDHSVSSNNSFKSHLKAKIFSMFLTPSKLCAAHDSASVSVARVM